MVLTKMTEGTRAPGSSMLNLAQFVAFDNHEYCVPSPDPINNNTQGIFHYDLCFYMRLDMVDI